MLSEVVSLNLLHVLNNTIYSKWRLCVKKVKLFQTCPIGLMKLSGFFSEWKSH